MKGWISLAIGVIIFYLIFFQIDPAIVAWVLSKVPESSYEWLGLIEIVVWIFTILWTISIGIWLSIMGSTLVYYLLGGE